MRPLPVPLPETIRLPKARLTAILLILIGAGFAAIGAGMVAEGNATGWIVGGFFGLCALAGVALLVGDSGVLLDREGFEVHSLWRRTRYRWQEVSVFDVRGVRQTRFLAFDDLAAPKRPLLDGANRFLIGANASIANSLIGGDLTYACALMNAFRARAVGAGE
jgi:hypothetical protein